MLGLISQKKASEFQVDKLTERMFLEILKPSLNIMSESYYTLVSMLIVKRYVSLYLIIYFWDEFTEYGSSSINDLHRFLLSSSLIQLNFEFILKCARAYRREMKKMREKKQRIFDNSNEPEK